mmetsp:Transcript_10143/g.14652  ORF Transcript_10143/g.14652 Transcript_10143/m.14652 type:complete len:81 (-) Transcript_10143:876-1118(-)
MEQFGITAVKEDGNVLTTMCIIHFHTQTDFYIVASGPLLVKVLVLSPSRLRRHDFVFQRFASQNGLTATLYFFDKETESK